MLQVQSNGLCGVGDVMVEALHKVLQLGQRGLQVEVVWVVLTGVLQNMLHTAHTHSASLNALSFLSA